MKEVLAIILPVGAKVGPISNDCFGAIYVYNPQYAPTHERLLVPTFDEFNELSNEVVWC